MTWKNKNSSSLVMPLGNQGHNDYDEDTYKARACMKKAGIKMNMDSVGNIKVYIPKETEKQLESLYKFSAKELSIGGDIPPEELARHLDRQSSEESRASVIAEHLRHEWMLLQVEYSVWYEQKFVEIKTNSTDRPSDKAVHARIVSRFPKAYSKWQRRLISAESSYRLVNNAMRAPLITKGRLLQSLRAIVGVLPNSEQRTQIET